MILLARAAMKDVASAAADASGLTVKEAEAAVRAAFDFIAAEVGRRKGKEKKRRMLFSIVGPDRLNKKLDLLSVLCSPPSAFLSLHQLSRTTKNARHPVKKTHT